MIGENQNRSTEKRRDLSEVVDVGREGPTKGLPHLPTDRKFDIDPPKILYAANVASFFHKFLLPYADHFRANGWKVDALSKGFDFDELSSRFDKLWEVDWARKPHELRSAKSIVHQIRTIADEGQYDLIHVHTPVAAMVTRYALRERRRHTNTKILYTAHGFHFFEGAPKVSGALFKRLEAVASGWTDFLIVMNEEDYAAARELKRIPHDRIVYMPGIGVDLARYDGRPEERESARAELKIEPEETMLLCVAEFIPRKRQSDLLFAMKRLEDPRIKVVFAGDGERLREVKDLAFRLGLADRVVFLGLHRNVPRLLSAADCCILPSSQEGLPRSVMESMCSGVPVIATNIRGTRELLENGVGVLYPVGDHQSLANAIREFAQNQEASKLRALQGIQRVQKYDVQSVIRMHEDIYAKALGKDRDELILDGAKPEGYLL